MAPRKDSRHTFTSAIFDSESRFHLTERDPFLFRDLPDNRRRIAERGDTLFTLAGLFFVPLPRPSGLWWVIADFQPEPILDPTLVLDPGRAIIIPSIRTVREEVFSEARRGEATP